MAETKGKQKFPTLFSPVGIAGYSWLTKPDSGGKFSDDKFKTVLYLDKGDADNIEFAKQINKANEDEGGERVVVKDGDEENKRRVKKKKEPRDVYVGKFVVQFKSKFQPDLVSRKKDPETGKAAKLPPGQEPRGGDLIKVAFAMVPYQAGENSGVSLQLRAVQLIEKRARQGYGDAFDVDDDEGDDSDQGSGSGDGGTKDF